MKKRLIHNSGHLVLGIFIVSVLAIWFSRYIQTTSFDLVQHFLLVDELDKYHGVRDGAFQRMGAMAIYPPIAHWMAVIAGWLFGSSLVGITVVTVASAFLVYVFIILLAGADSSTRLLLFAAAFLTLGFTKSQIGWEVIDNFFYPQLVADVVYFGVLLWAANSKGEWKQAICFLLIGLVTMWIQPLIAIHVFAAGCTLVAFQLLKRWTLDSLPVKHTFACLVALAAGAAIIVLTNPAFRVMREISANDGWLNFGYSSVLLVAFACAAFGAWNLQRYWNGKGEYVDAVVGTAVVAAFGLVILQFALLKLHGDGSAYAIKKHMFIVFTLGILNAVRVIASYLPTGKVLRPGLVAPIFAGIASLFVLKGLNTPVAPILEALAYANHAFQDKSTGYAPGNTVSHEGTLPLMGNVMVSLTAFQHPFDARAIAWQGGASIKDGADYVMMRRTSRMSKLCNFSVTTKDSYIILPSACLSNYIPGESLTFSPDGTGWQYIVDGWSAAEPWGAWTLGNLGGAIKLSVPSGKYRLIIDGRVYVAEQHPTQDIVIEVNGKDIATWNFDLAAPIATRSVDIPENLSQDGSLRIILKAPGSVSPAQLGQSADARVIGLGVQTLTLNAIP